MAEKIVQGHFLRILVNGNPIAGAKECSLKITNDTDEVSNKDTGRGKSFVYARYTFSLSTSAVAITGVTETGLGAKTSYDTLMGLAIAGGDAIDWEFADTAVGAVYKKYSGKALITDTDLGAPDYKAGTFSLSLSGTGDITETDID